MVESISKTAEGLGPLRAALPSGTSFQPLPKNSPWKNLTFALKSRIFDCNLQFRMVKEDMKIQLKYFKQIVINNLKRRQEGKCAVCADDLGQDQVVVRYSDGIKDGLVVGESDLDLIHLHCVRSGKDGRKDQVLKLKEEGLKSSEIATRVGISITSVYNYLKGS